MGTFDFVYQNKILQLQEENNKLRNIINEIAGGVGTPADQMLSKERLAHTRLGVVTCFIHARDISTFFVHGEFIPALTGSGFPFRHLGWADRIHPA